MERQKRKPRQIMVQYRDPETGQMTTKVVDKVVRKRVSTLKKVILKKRELDKKQRALKKETRRELREALADSQQN